MQVLLSLIEVVTELVLLYLIEVVTKAGFTVLYRGGH